ncbi:Crp/Fnr family transcriptional regulator [Actinomadura sp. WMMB 499]|uniref:Crp/Fnr family transcriptional regulator n=1 Tax=Actinomadura sp. WMMB 499 TaxID=1219491 RepID=UPI00159D7585|nr:cyclic nucleotide-binding domain-containing protein [Actinomadura sp. WMMB 499]
MRSRGRGGRESPKPLSARVTTPVTLFGLVLGYALDGSAGAAVAGVVAFLSLPAAAVTTAVVQYMRDGTPESSAPEEPAASRSTDLATGARAAPVEPAAGRYPETTFWGALSQDERRALLASARGHVYRKEDVLCEEGGLASEVIVIVDGWTRVWVRDGIDERIVAFRGPGELVGERAALLVRDRSATVTAEGDVAALRVPDGAFGAFLAAHPRVRAVLERQVYRRQTEDRGPAPPDWSDGNCSVLVTDITGFGSPRRTDADRRVVAAAMYEWLDAAFAASGIDFSRLYQEDRGDGALVVVPPTTPTERVVDPMLAHLAASLRRHNRRAADATRLQLRAALHVGPVRRGDRGVSGMALITAARLVDAPAVKRRVAETGADLAFVASDFVYDSVIRSGPGLVDPHRYSRVRVRVKEASLSAWLTLEGGTTWPQAM